MSDKRRRRTASAADVELAAAHTMSTVAESPLSQRPRRKSNARQARLVGYPIHLMAPGGQQEPQMCNGFNYQQVPSIRENSLIFGLVPNSSVPYTFFVDTNKNNTFILNSQVQPLTINLNGAVFQVLSMPSNVSQYIVQGKNFIVLTSLGYMFFGAIAEIAMSYTNFNEQRFIQNQNLNIQEELPMTTEPPHSVSMPSLHNYPEVPTQSSLDDMVQVVLNNEGTLPQTSDQTTISSICPISNTEMVNPCRGINCQHSQCFDLKNYISKSSESGLWQCPVCGNPLPLTDLRVDREYFLHANIQLETIDFEDNYIFEDGSFTSFN